MVGSRASICAASARLWWRSPRRLQLRSGPARSSAPASVAASTAVPLVERHDRSADADAVEDDDAGADRQPPASHVRGAAHHDARVRRRCPTAALTVVLNPGHNGGNGSHPAEINRQVPAGYGDYKACDTTGNETRTPATASTPSTGTSPKRVRSILQAHGIRVVMTRPDDAGVGPCVDERAAIGNRAGVAAVISIHADGAPSTGHGFHVNQDSRRPGRRERRDRPALASTSAGRCTRPCNSRPVSSRPPTSGRTATTTAATSPG